MLKRFFDILVSLLLLVFLFPFVIIISVWIYRSLGAPVLFKQYRPGRDGAGFRMVKFRTMRDSFDYHGEPLPDEERLTPFGKWLRSTSLDELPELWNVVKGDMSLVGPRPLLMEYLPLYTEEQRRRHEVRPGITGWAQVNGRNTISWDEKFNLDIWYVENQSFFLDIKILWKTLNKVLRRDGITAEGESTMRKFTGKKQ
jgi:lipopolysaccharide/colanic/teichoic acid biosynthesis glycosyltransferase